MEQETFRRMRLVIGRHLSEGSRARELLPKRWEEIAVALIEGGLLKETKDSSSGGPREYALTARGHEHLSRIHEHTGTEPGSSGSPS